ncbi:hypothetical protein [Nocardia stercoris]|uniref:hypothetical protein n=1 Tax=Nocardia stercoris TaxID=2483361 RepID=UPI0011C40DEC|nr:hypothetical protein [Nocardia stercoris]
MPTMPLWVRRNRAVAWVGYVAVLITFATLPMALTAAGTGHTGFALLAGGICAAALITGVTLVSTTVHRDHTQHHATPNLLADSWDQTTAARRRRRSR